MKIINAIDLQDLWFQAVYDILEEGERKTAYLRVRRRNRKTKNMEGSMKKGDFALATKYDDGDPLDHWCVGYYEGMTSHKKPRYEIVDWKGDLFRGNGFRRAKKITYKRGQFLLDNKKTIELSGKSLWWWVRQTMKERVV